jgi:hypothetical protein
MASTPQSCTWGGVEWGEAPVLRAQTACKSTQIVSLGRLVCSRIASFSVHAGYCCLCTQGLVCHATFILQGNCLTWCLDLQAQKQSGTGPWMSLRRCSHEQALTSTAWHSMCVNGCEMRCSVAARRVGRTTTQAAQQAVLSKGHTDRAQITHT